MKKGTCMFRHKDRNGGKRKKILELDWNRQWDIVLFSGRMYINVVITDVDGEGLFVYNMKIPGYEELGGERSWGLPLFAVKSITESPKRDACLGPVVDPLGIVGSYYGDYRMMYLSPEERKQYGAILVDDLWSLMSADGTKHIRILGVDATIWIFPDTLGRIHMRHSTTSFGARTHCILEDR